MDLLKQIKWVQVIRAVCLLVLLYSLYMVVSMVKDRVVNAQSYEDTRKLYELDKRAATDDVEDVKSLESTPALSEPPVKLHPVVQESVALPNKQAPHKEAAPPENTFANLKKANKDFVGWIHIRDTNIDYPVVQTSDNEYYLNHNFRKSENIGGAIFMDYRVKLDSPSRNTIIYGHHMKDGSMFTDLLKFLKQDFYEDHPVISLEMLDGEETSWEIFSAYITNTEFNYIIPDFETDKEYDSFLKSIKRKSVIKPDVKVTKSDRIITLSTCSYSIKDGRMVVHARKKE